MTDPLHLLALRREHLIRRASQQRLELRSALPRGLLGWAGLPLHGLWHRHSHWLKPLLASTAPMLVVVLLRKPGRFMRLARWVVPVVQALRAMQRQAPG